MSTAQPNARMAWPMLLAASAILMVTMGVRQTNGLLIAPIQADTGLGIAQISFALAIGQFVWGAVQPAFGALADQRGPLPVLIAGGLLLAAGLALAPLLPGAWGLNLSLGILLAAGAGAGSFSVLIGASAWRIPEKQRSMAAGIINAGGSLGQFLFAPLVQVLLAAFGWVRTLYALAAIVLLSLPLAWPLRHRAPRSAENADDGLRAQLRTALRSRSYWLLHLGFFTCGVHVAFLITHLPGEIALCGLPASVSATSIALIGLFNVAGSLAIGALGQRYRMKWLLFWLYASRALMIIAYLLAPPSATTFYVFSAALGLTWLATVPPTAGLVGKLFGPRHMGHFRLTLFSHQIGAFFGAWLGGVVLENTHSYLLMWQADIALAVIAALIHLPIREAKLARQQAACA